MNEVPTKDMTETEPVKSSISDYLDLYEFRVDPDEVLWIIPKRKASLEEKNSFMEFIKRWIPDTARFFSTSPGMFYKILEMEERMKLLDTAPMMLLFREVPGVIRDEMTIVRAPGPEIVD